MQQFENDVEMYGAQTSLMTEKTQIKFENDVEMYGAQTIGFRSDLAKTFENDVEMYGAQTGKILIRDIESLRMM